MNERDEQTLKTIVRYCETIEQDLSRINEDSNRFYEDYDIQRIIAFDLQQIGEAVGRLSEDLKNNNKQIPWGNIKGLRNRVTHAYDSIDLDTVWFTCIDDIPMLAKETKKILNSKK